MASGSHAPSAPAASRTGGAAALALLAALAVLLGCLVAVAIARPRLAGLDEYDYVDVARHVARGDGLVQSTLGYNAARFPVEGTWPVPFVAQPPLYPSLVAGLIRVGAEPLRAGILVSVISLALVCAFGFLLARTLWDTRAGVMALVLLVPATAATGAALHALSDLPAMALLLLSAWLEARHLASPGSSVGPSWAPFAAGLASGFVFATRYFLALALPLGVVFFLLRGRWLRRLLEAAAFVVGWLIAAAPVMLRSLALTGSALGPERNASHVSLRENLAQLSGGLLGSPSRAAIVAVGVGLGVAIVARAARRGGLRPMVGGARALPLTWALAYLLGLVLLRTHVYFDVIGFRLLAPGLTLAAVAFAPVAAQAWPTHTARLQWTPLSWRSPAPRFRWRTWLAVAGSPTRNGSPAPRGCRGSVTIRARTIS